MSLQVDPFVSVLVSVLFILFIAYLPFLLTDVVKMIIVDVLPERFRYGRMWSVIHRFQRAKVSYLSALPSITFTSHGTFKYYLLTIQDTLCKYHSHEKDYYTAVKFIVAVSTYASDEEKREIAEMVWSLKNIVPSLRYAFALSDKSDIEKMLQYDAMTRRYFFKSLKKSSRK